MTGLFHFSFAEPDPGAAKSIYAGMPGSAPGRDQGTRVDRRFFGHQLTMHARTDAIVWGRIDHFGPIPHKADREALAERLRQTEYCVQTRIRPANRRMAGGESC